MGTMDYNQLIFPPGCEPIEASLESVELMRRLKKLWHVLRGFETQARWQEMYLQLAVHLTIDPILKHANERVSFFASVCVTDMIRAIPDFLNKIKSSVPEIFDVLFEHIGGLRNRVDQANPLRIYMLKNLKMVNAFDFCLEDEETRPVLRKLFRLMFEVIQSNDDESMRVAALLVLSPLLDSEAICMETLGVVLVNLTQAHENAQWLAKSLMASGFPQIYANTQLHQVLLRDTDEDKEVYPRIHDIAWTVQNEHSWKLGGIYDDPPKSIIKAMNSGNVRDRRRAAVVLAHLFTHKNSKYVYDDDLWRTFLRGFDDPAMSVRIACVRHAAAVLAVQPTRRRELLSRVLRNDREEEVRGEAVAAVTALARGNFDVFLQHQLHLFLDQQSLDESWAVAKLAVESMARIYGLEVEKDLSKFLINAVVGWKLDRFKDQLCRLLDDIIAPPGLPVSSRARTLYRIFCELDDNGVAAFVEMERQRRTRRATFLRWLNLVEEEQRREESGEAKRRWFDEEFALASKWVGSYCGNVKDVGQILHMLVNKLRDDPTLLPDLKTMLRPELSLKELVETGARISGSFETPSSNDMNYLRATRLLMQRTGPVLVDRETVASLLDCATCSLTSEAIEQTVYVDRGFQLLEVLASFYPSYFHGGILRELSFCFAQHSVACRIFAISTKLLTSDPPLHLTYEMRNFLEIRCRQFAVDGTPQQAKHAVLCLCTALPNSDQVLDEILEAIEPHLVQTSEKCEAAVTVLGHIAQHAPNPDSENIRRLVLQKVSPLVHANTTESTVDAVPRQWCKREQLPRLTRVRVRALKCAAQYLRVEDKKAVVEVLDMLNRFIVHRHRRISLAEMNWVRLQAARSTLKICESREVGDNYAARHVYGLSQLMQDSTEEVRKIFARKLARGFANHRDRCLSRDFLALYVLAGFEREEPQKRRLWEDYNEIIREKNKWVAYGVNVLDESADIWANLAPECSLGVAVAILAHGPFDPHYDAEQFQQLEDCLLLFLAPYFSVEDAAQQVKYYHYFKRLLKKLTRCRDIEDPEGWAINAKLETVCHLASKIVEEEFPQSVRERPSPTVLEPCVPWRYLVFDEAIDGESRHFVPQQVKNRVRKPSKNSILERLFPVAYKPKRKYPPLKKVGAVAKRRKLIR